MSAATKTIDIEIHLTLPDDLARELKASGLLEQRRLESLFRSELRANRVRDLFAAADRLAEIPGPEPTALEVETEIEEVRSRRRLAHASGR